MKKYLFRKKSFGDLQLKWICAAILGEINQVTESTVKENGNSKTLDIIT